MNDKTLQIVEAAKVRFTRHGFAKTTMGDIAEEAGVARQTVYNAFTSKEEILRAVVQVVGTESIQHVEAAWDKVDTLPKKLELFHEMVPAYWYVELHKSPDWAELMEGMHAVAREELTVLDTAWKSKLAEVFATHTPAMSEDEVTEIVDFFYVTSLNAKHGVRDLDHLRTRLATICRATLALV